VSANSQPQAAGAIAPEHVGHASQPAALTKDSAAASHIVSQPAPLAEPAPVPPAEPASIQQRLRTLLQTLLDEPWRFSFDAAVAVMMRAAGRGNPGAAIRFHTPPGLGFVPADMQSVMREGDGFRAATGLLGLTGPSGVLPRPYTETVNAEQRRHSLALAAFLDLLAQRVLAHFAAAPIKYRPHRAADAAAIQANEIGRTKDGMRDALLAFTGYGMPGAANQLAIGSDALLYYAGAFAAWPRSADQLGAILCDWLGQKVEIEQFAGGWLSLGPEERSTLPASGRSGQFYQLGVDASAGARAWDIQSRIVLRIGPLPLDAFAALLPGGVLLQRLVALTRAYLGDQIGVTINPVLAANAVPRPVLGGASAPRLGRNGWLPTSGGRKRDATEARFGA
jgi:type VI secretion system protein ImpH